LEDVILPNNKLFGHGGLMCN